MRLPIRQIEGVVKSFDAFLGDYSQSSLRPNALFGKSISLAGLGTARCVARDPDAVHR